MTAAELEKASFPIGRHIQPDTYTDKELKEWITLIEAMPSWLDPTIENLDAAQMEVPYRPGGWNTRQVIHHLADSHMNGLIRVKFALTQDKPSIMPYNQDEWVAMADVEQVPVNVSITLLHSLHRRWSTLLRSLSKEELDRGYYHPEYKISVTIWQMTAQYAWHGHHHVEQIRSLRLRMGWS